MFLRALALVMLMSLSESIQDFPTVQYCLETPDHQANDSVHSFTIEGQLADQFGRSIVCQIPNGKNTSFLYIKASKQSTGSLQVTVFNSEMAQTIGELEVKRNERNNSNLVCLNETGEPERENMYIVISGTPKLNFTVQIQFINNELSLGESDKTEFQGKKIFLFSPKRQSKDVQLEIIVRSDTDSEGILTVSHYCSQTEKRSQTIDHSKPSISLTFSRQGKITLSTVSKPPFNPTSKQPKTLFISILPVDNSNNFEKTGHIELKTSFDYDYLKPICFIVFLSFFGGILVAYWAVKCFKEPLLLVSSSGSSLEDTRSAGESVRSDESSVRIKDSSFLGCCRGSDDKSELKPLLSKSQEKSHSTQSEFFRAMWAVLRYHWIGKGKKPFSYITCIVGFVLLVGAFQFVYVNWSIMVDDGIRDKCFYNDFCYRVSPHADIPFNLMISNLSYMIHGIILAWSMWVMEAELYIQARKKATIERRKRPRTTENGEKLPPHTLICSNLHVHLPELSVPAFQCSDEKRILQIYTRAYKNKYSLSIGYAFAWALIFEGLFSLTYHLCPSRLTFQFDSAFMFVIAGLIVVSLFNGISAKECQKQVGNPRPIEDTTFFLFIIVPLYILNYLGSLYNEYDGKGSSKPVYVIFIVAMVAWYMATFFWCLNKLFHSSFKNGFHTFESKVKLVLFVFAVITTCIVFPSLFYGDFSHLFLFSCIAAALASSIGKISIMAYKAFKADYMSYRTIPLRVFQGAYIICTLGIMSAAIYVFQGIPTSDKTKSPAASRNLNKDCVLLGFYDYHDVWHIMSSFGLLMGIFLIMYISD